VKRVLALFLIIVISSCDSPPPSDEQLISLFKEKKVVFEQLRKMICADQYKYVYVGGSSKPTKIPQTKLDEYYGLLNSISAEAVIRGKGCNISIPMWSVGSGGVSKTKGFVQQPGIEGEYVSSLDDKHTKRKSKAFFYRKLDREWTLYYYDWL
jgi:hypothetical protein